MKLTIEEVARCLDVPLSTVERWIRQGRIPIRKTGGKCVFQKEVLEVWAKTHHLPFAISAEQNQETSDEEKLIDLSHAMERGGVFYNIKGNSPETVLMSAVEMIFVIPELKRKLLYQKLMERESMNSTGIGNGIAIPHPRTPSPDIIEKPVIFTFFTEQPINYRAIDDQPVFMLFMLLSPSVKVHLHLLSRLAYCVRDNEFLEFLKTAPDESELLSRIKGVEKVLD
jgi:PTS system nitrogen regulatory IIA component